MLKILFIIIIIIIIIICVFLIYTIYNTVLSKQLDKNNISNKDIIENLYEYRIENIKTMPEIPPNFRKNFDWAKNNNQYGRICVNPVRSQGECGSCWAFALICVIESAIFRYNLDSTKLDPTNSLQILSVQQIIDSTSSKKGETPGLPCKGCEGCDVGNLIFFERDMYICKDVDYPYTLGLRQDASAYNYPGSKQIEKCGQNNNLNAILITNFKFNGIPELFSPVDLKKLLFNKGPVYWGVLVPDNGLCTWLSALGGLYNGSLSTNNNRGHALVITGWGWSSINGKYWIVRNSWGSSLIDNGYVYIPMKEPGYYPTGSNKAGKLIYKNLYTAYIRRPDCNSSKININIIGGPAYLPNNISIVQFTVQVYIEDPENFDISFKIISDSKYLLENNIVNSENFVVEKDKKVTDNVTN